MPTKTSTPLLALALALGGLGLAPTAAEAGRHAHRSHHTSHTGRILVDNDRGEVVRVYLDGDYQGLLAAHASRSFRVPSGSHAVEVRDQRGRVLERRTVGIHRGETERIEVDPVMTGALVVRNPLERVVMVRVDGKRTVSLAPRGSSRLALDLGSHRLELLLPDGRVIATGSERIERYGTASWRPAPAMVGSLTIDNPLPIAVVVTGERGRSRTLAPGQSMTVDGVAAGTRTLTVRRASGGEEIGELCVRIEAFEASFAQVPTPQTGIVVVDNDRNWAVEVFIDGAFVGTVEAGQRQRLEVRPGTRTVELRSSRSGRLLDETRVRVGRYQPVEVEVPPREHRPTEHVRPDHHEDPPAYDDFLSLYFDRNGDVVVSATFDLD